MSPLRAWCLGVCCLLLMACTPTMKEARQLRSSGKTQASLKAYKAIARPGGTMKALKAQAAVVELVTQLEQWGDLPTEGAKLASYLDSEDEWYRQHRSKKARWSQGLGMISKTLMSCGRKALQRARRLGDPVAYVAAGRLYGLYMERFPQGHQRVEAAAGRGVALAVRGDCKLAMGLFENAARWAIAARSLAMMQKGKAPKQPPQLKQMLFRGGLGCRVKLWQEERAKLLEAFIDLRSRKPKPGDKERILKRKQRSDRAFAQILAEAQRLLRFAPRAGAVDLLRHAQLLQRGGAFAGALHVFLLLIDESKIPTASLLAKRKILQLFGMTKAWGPLLAPLKARLARVPAKSRDVFWKRVQSLAVLHGIRTAKAMLRERKPKQAGAMLLSIYKEAPKTIRMLQAFYHAALALEEQKQLMPASKLFRELFDRFPKHRMAPMALYRHADVLKKLTRLPQSASAFELLANSYPKLKVAPRVYIGARSLYEAFHCYRRMGAFARARKILRWLMRSYPRSLSAARMRVYLRRSPLPRGRRRRFRRRRRRWRRRRRRRRRRRTRRRRTRSAAPTKARP